MHVTDKGGPEGGAVLAWVRDTAPLLSEPKPSVRIASSVNGRWTSRLVARSAESPGIATSGSATYLAYDVPARPGSPRHVVVANNTGGGALRTKKTFTNDLGLWAWY